MQISWPDGNTVGHPLPSDGAIHECIGGGDWTHEGPTSARTSFKLPVDSDALYVFARGSLASGRITIVDSQPIDASDDVVFSVRVKYYSSWALDRANVCQLARKEGENGVGIFVSISHFRDGLRLMNRSRHPNIGIMLERKTVWTLISSSIYPPVSDVTPSISKISKPTFLYSFTNQELWPRL